MRWQARRLPLFRFTIRHLLWLTAFVALGTAWWVEHRRNSAPRLFQETAFTAASFAEAVNHTHSILK